MATTQFRKHQLESLEEKQERQQREAPPKVVKYQAQTLEVKKER